MHKQNEDKIRQLQLDLNNMQEGVKSKKDQQTHNKQYESGYVFNNNGFPVTNPLFDMSSQSSRRPLGANQLETFRSN